MLEVLEKINFPSPSSMKRSGDIRMWVYVGSRTGGQCLSLVLHPSLTAGEAAHVVGQEAGLDTDTINNMTIHEVSIQCCKDVGFDQCCAVGCDGRQSREAAAPL